MAYPTYSSYRDSGVAWLGEVPSHWGVIPIKQIIKEHSGNGFPIELQGNNGDIPFLKVGDLNKQGKLLQSYSNLVTNELVKEKKWNIVPKFSLIAPKIGEALKKNHRKIVLDDVIIDNNCIAFECLKVDLNYHYYLSLIIDFNWFENGGTVPSISVQKYKKQKVCLPPLAEQTAIADYLDTQTAQIDALIDKQQNLLAKLAEQRSATISQAVTRGLNPNAPMKESDVVWLGEVPKHWEVKRLRFAIQLNPVKSELNLPDDALVSFVPMEAVNLHRNLTLTQEKNISEVYKGYTYFRDNDIVIAKITPCFENGKSAIAQNLTNGIAFGTTELHVLRVNNLLSNPFLYYLSKSDLFMKAGEAEMYGAGGQKRVPEEFIKNFQVALPPLAEQTAIADYLDTQIAHIDCLSQKVEQAIGRLKEYRTALITQAVTGKIKVITEG